MRQDIETTFYSQGMTVVDKLGFLVDRLTDIGDRISDISYEIGRDNLNR
jgi:hypothetical protein